jgi:hydrogenase nickel incorporation protein HypA/HybF
MHELPITENILRIALDYAERSEATRVTGLNLVIGQLASVVDDSVQFYWDFVSKDTLCEGAVLHFDRIPAEMICLECDHTYILSKGLEACPQCESFRIKVQSGEEFRLESIDIETE